ncbi:hypothetical protein EUGRSUZ_I00546 [Eucalyptus grandis]|uniref:Uncharacterized protein n=2 Tax=Eucalyptus grandis TaxID=71139 RepID=A0ACC3JCR1_EUCGR|nr:hypothetical protein EUGRSUZ_I00546 [Eucalyptus grandis]
MSRSSSSRAMLQSTIPTQTQRMIRRCTRWTFTCNLSNEEREIHFCSTRPSCVVSGVHYLWNGRFRQNALL